MKFSRDTSMKIRTAIKVKLAEIGNDVYEELPDYIMVMVANKKSEEQMNEDLSLFLGDKTDRFTSWLHSLLLKLQSIVSETSVSGTARQPKGAAQNSSDSARSSVPDVNEGTSQNSGSEDEVCGNDVPDFEEENVNNGSPVHQAHCSSDIRFSEEAQGSDLDYEDEPDIDSRIGSDVVSADEAQNSGIDSADEAQNSDINSADDTHRSDIIYSDRIPTHEDSTENEAYGSSATNDVDENDIIHSTTSTEKSCIQSSDENSAKHITFTKCTISDTSCLDKGLSSVEFADEALTADDSVPKTLARVSPDKVLDKDLPNETQARDFMEVTPADQSADTRDPPAVIPDSVGGSVDDPSSTDSTTMTVCDSAGEQPASATAKGFDDEVLGENSEDKVHQKQPREAMGCEQLSKADDPDSTSVHIVTSNQERTEPSESNRLSYEMFGQSGNTQTEYNDHKGKINKENATEGNFEVSLLDNEHNKNVEGNVNTESKVDSNNDIDTKCKANISETCKAKTCSSSSKEAEPSYNKTIMKPGLDANEAFNEGKTCKTDSFSNKNVGIKTDKDMKEQNKLGSVKVEKKVYKEETSKTDFSVSVSDKSQSGNEENSASRSQTEVVSEKVANTTPVPFVSDFDKNQLTEKMISLTKKETTSIVDTPCRVVEKSIDRKNIENKTKSDSAAKITNTDKNLSVSRENKKCTNFQEGKAREKSELKLIKGSKGDSLLGNKDIKVPVSKCNSEHCDDGTKTDARAKVMKEGLMTSISKDEVCKKVVHNTGQTATIQSNVFSESDAKIGRKKVKNQDQPSSVGNIEELNLKKNFKSEQRLKAAEDKSNTVERKVPDVQKGKSICSEQQKTKKNKNSGTCKQLQKTDIVKKQTDSEKKKYKSDQTTSLHESQNKRKSDSEPKAVVEKSLKADSPSSTQKDLRHRLSGKHDHKLKTDSESKSFEREKRKIDGPSAPEDLRHKLTSKLHKQKQKADPELKSDKNKVQETSFTSSYQESSKHKAIKTSDYKHPPDSEAKSDKNICKAHSTLPVQEHKEVKAPEKRAEKLKIASSDKVKMSSPKTEKGRSEIKEKCELKPKNDSHAKPEDVATGPSGELKKGESHSKQEHKMPDMKNRTDEIEIKVDDKKERVDLISSKYDREKVGKSVQGSYQYETGFDRQKDEITKNKVVLVTSTHIHNSTHKLHDKNVGNLTSSKDFSSKKSRTESRPMERGGEEKYRSSKQNKKYKIDSDTEFKIIKVKVQTSSARETERVCILDKNDQKYESGSGFRTVKMQKIDQTYSSGADKKVRTSDKTYQTQSLDCAVRTVKNNVPDTSISIKETKRKSSPVSDRPDLKRKISTDSKATEAKIRKASPSSPLLEDGRLLTQKCKDKREKKTVDIKDHDRYVSSFSKDGASQEPSNSRSKTFEKSSLFKAKSRKTDYLSSGKLERRYRPRSEQTYIDRDCDNIPCQVSSTNKKTRRERRSSSESSGRSSEEGRKGSRHFRLKEKRKRF